VGCEHHAAAGPGLLADAQVTEDAVAAYDPLGVIRVVMSWKYRFWHVLHFAGFRRERLRQGNWPHGGGDPTMAR
jgi:hypothetical protein